MSFKNINPVYPNNYGWLEIDLDSDAINKLKNYIKKDNLKKHNNVLAGNISKSYLLNDKDNWFFKNVLIECIKRYKKNFPGYIESLKIMTHFHSFLLDSIWVNFQKKNEFNPPHVHSGIFSFVIWINIPYDYEKEHAVPFSKGSKNPSASDFIFQYINTIGFINTFRYCLSKKDNGRMLFFPSSLAHQVFPFYTSNKERISISGNVNLDSKKVIDV